jgi:hypothetical protein
MRAYPRNSDPKSPNRRLSYHKTTKEIKLQLQEEMLVSFQTVTQCVTKVVVFKFEDQ